MMASPVADNVSTTLAPLSANLSRNRRCLRAQAPMIASTYSYRGPSGDDRAVGDVEGGFGC